MSLHRMPFGLMALVLAFCSFAVPANSFAEGYVIDVSGSAGVAGRNGANGSSYGSPGGHATASTPGTNAGTISVRLSSSGDGRVVISGSHSGSFALGSSGQLQLRAVGGRGGDGANGGHGGDGRPGKDGRDARKDLSATDGTDGEDGGPGGNGTSGSAGGAGGRISVTVNEKDMNLLALVAEPKVSGGPGGQAGQNGSGGSGGAGGRGGDGTTWQVPYQSTCTRNVTVHKTCSKTVSRSNGNGSSISMDVDYDCSEDKQESYSCTQFRTESLPSGRNGSRGADGSPGNALISSGAAGKNGSFEYIVEYNDGRRLSYPRPFDLQITGFELRSDFSEAFMEPGEKMKIASITVANTGGMPSPTLTPVRVRLAQSAPVMTTGSVDLTQSIAPGEQVTLRGEIASEVLRTALTIAGATPENHHRGGPKSKISLSLEGEIVGVNRVTVFSGSRASDIRYPISIAKVLGKGSVGRGDEYLFRWSVEKHSNRSLGSGQSSRGIRFIPNFAFKSGRGSLGFSLNAGADAKDATHAWARFGFTDDAKILETGTMTIRAELEDPYIKGQWTAVDVAYFPIKVGVPFKKNRGSSVLLVTNPQTEESELKAWKDLFLEAGRIADIWDLGIMGPLDLARDDLGLQYAGSTIVILGDLVQQPGQEKVPADAVFKLGSSDFTDLAKRNRISVLVFDRTGSYATRAGLFGLKSDRKSSDPMLVAPKVSEQDFRSAAFIQGDATLLSLVMASSFDQKLDGFNRALQLNQLRLAAAYSVALLQDLASEQVLVRSGEKATAEDFPLLAAFSLGLKDSLTPEAQMLVTELVAGVVFVSKSQNRWWGNHPARGITEDQLKQIQQRLNCPQDAIEKKMEGLEIKARRLEKSIREGDKTRFWTFPRAWAGDYYRQAAFSVVLKPSYERAYTHQLELFDDVLSQERQALPAFQ